MRKKIFFLVGPTASGKTDIALILAKKLNAEIVSCDAMQAYKELSILTAKPSVTALKTIRHYLVNVVSVEENFDVFSFRKKVLEAIGVIERKKKIPLIVGGSGLYMTILLDGIFEEEKGGRNLALRQKIEEAICLKGADAVYTRLKQVDPASAARIHPNDTRRLVRALEVFETYGKPISALHRERKGLEAEYDILSFAISLPRDVLYARINARVEKMFVQGAVAEVKKISKKVISQTASGVIGLKEIQFFLAGKLTEDQAKEQIQRNTRRYAKRQLTWFRRDARLTWIKAGAKDRPAQIAKNILTQMRKNG